MGAAKQKKGDWVVAGGKDGESAHCTRCGEGLNLGTQRIDVWVAASAAFVKAHGNCKEGQYVPPPATTPNGWLHGRDTGTSSLTIFSVITGRKGPRREYDAPHDPEDFGRCYRLLKLFPAWRSELPKVATACPVFAPMIAEWDKLTRLYEEELPTGTAPKLYAEIKRLRERK